MQPKFALIAINILLIVVVLVSLLTNRAKLFFFVQSMASLTNNFRVPHIRRKLLYHTRTAIIVRQNDLLTAKALLAVVAKPWINSKIITICPPER